jgi:glucose/arabinose dehydrogenase
MIAFKKHLLSTCLALAAVLATACTMGLSEQKNNTVDAVRISQENAVDIQEFASGLNHPWGMTFLPDGRLLVTEREGRLRILDKNKKLSKPLQGVPEVYHRGQGGLLDVALDPDFKNNGYVYLSFSEPGDNNTASTALGRGQLENDRLSDFSVIFRQEPKVDEKNHFGGRIVFSSGAIFLTMGERFKFQPAQDNSNHLGTIVRLNRDGSAVKGNPFTGNEKGRAEIWSYGHRNIEAAAFDPSTGQLWVAEMGPEGGDELNLIEEGKNYGWPIVSWGRHYNGEAIPKPSTRPEFADAALHWTPVISPSGMEFYSGDLFPEYKGNMLIGGLSAEGLVRVQINNDKAKEIGRIDLGARIRDVEEAPDGSLYVLTDKANGQVLRLVPKDHKDVATERRE